MMWGSIILSGGKVLRPGKPGIERICHPEAANGRPKDLRMREWSPRTPSHPEILRRGACAEEVRQDRRSAPQNDNSTTIGSLARISHEEEEKAAALCY